MTFFSDDVTPAYWVDNVAFYEDQIRTTVTETAAVVDGWIAEVLRIHRHKLHNLFVGLDTEWRPSFNPNVHNQVAILQLCVGHRCLIFQLLHANMIPQSLIAFLNNQNFTFVGVGIKADVKKLFEDYGLWVASTMDLPSLAAIRFDDEDFKRMGLKRLGIEFLGKEMEKPKNITLSRWDAVYLSTAQIEYACIDAFVSFALGMHLYWPKH